MILKLLIFILTIMSYNSYSQEITSSGKEFYFAFPPNYHTNIFESSTRLSRGDSLYVFIATEEATKGYIEVNDIFDNSQTFTFNITNPDEVYAIAKSFWDFEMISYKFVKDFDRYDDENGHPLRNTNHNEEVSKLSWHLVSEKDVTVTIMNQATYTSDGTLLFPVNSLGKDYIVAAYYSHNISNGSTPSQFVIIGTEDNTDITIFPSSPTQKLKNQTQRVILNKGETYLVQSEIDNGNDLTGTIVNADKNIVLIGGQLRAKAPIERDGESRDHLISQNIPIDKWGKSAFSIPFVQRGSNSSRLGKDIIRVISAKDNTEIFVNGVSTIILDKGQFYDIFENKALNISSNNSISVVQYKKSLFSDNFELSDPFMMIIPPKEQYLKKYKTISPSTTETQRRWWGFEENTVFTEHYINIVIENEFINTLKINGVLVTNQTWNNVPNSTYSYAQIRVSPGTKLVEADTTFGITSYGYGLANSYGYVGGLGLKNLENKTPTISSVLDCYEINGVIEDEMLESINILDETNINFTQNINADSSLGTFDAKLVDKYNDGEFTIIIKDTSGLEVSEKYQIKGFTFSVDTTNEVLIENYKYADNKNFCKKYTVKNYGMFDKTIENIELRGDVGLFTVDYNFPMNLKADEEVTIEICFDTKGKLGEYKLELDLITLCEQENRIQLTLDIDKDSKSPEILAKSSDCDRSINLSITESDIFDYGIKEFRIIDSLNIKVESKISNAFELDLDFTVIDPYQDAYLSVEVEDSAGFINSFERIIPGHTLGFGDNQERSSEINFGNIIKNNSDCYLLPIYNYGNYAITYFNYTLPDNQEFSIPFSQFPLTILPKDSVKLEICVNSQNLAELELDTLILNSLCIDTKIPMESFIIQEINKTNSKCNLQIILKESTEFKGVSEVYPNPLQNQLNIDIASLYEGELIYYILDLGGNIVVKNTINITQGMFKLEIDITELKNGAHDIIIEFEGQRIIRKFIVNK